MKMKVLLLDIETAPNQAYVWGLFNVNISLNQIQESGYTLCWAAKWLGEKDILYADIREGNGVMLQKIYDLVSEADVVVHYYGSHFDMPTLNREWVSQGWTPPAPYQQIDLCNVVKKRFKFTSNKLDYIAQQLGIGKKVKHLGMDLWRGCMNGDDEAWATMEKYNKQDVALLEKLYEKLLAWIPSPPNQALFVDDVEMLCPSCGSKHLQKRGFHRTKTQTYQRFRCSDCGAWSRARTTELSKDKRKAVVASAN